MPGVAAGNRNVRRRGSSIDLDTLSVCVLHLIIVEPGRGRAGKLNTGRTLIGWHRTASKHVARGRIKAFGVYPVRRNLRIATCGVRDELSASRAVSHLVPIVFHGITI